MPAYIPYPHSEGVYINRNIDKEHSSTSNSSFSFFLSYKFGRTDKPNTLLLLPIYKSEFSETNNKMSVRCIRA